MRSFLLGEAVCDIAQLRVGGHTLTPQEAELLKLFAERALQPVERMEFYREVWGYRSLPRGRALDFAVRRLRQRLESAGAPEGVIETVRGVGFRLTVEPRSIELAKEAPEAPGAIAVNQTAVGGSVLPRDQFVGRGEQRERVRGSLKGGRLVTLVGPPGVGKSRLALEALRESIAQTLVLKGQEIQSAEDLLGCFQEALERPAADSALDVARSLRELGMEFVLLENADKLSERACEALDAIHAHGKGLSLLVTRRGPLHVGAERVISVAPLSVEEAANLFCERVRRLGVSIELDDEVRGLVAQLDGLPLAIELAATRARVLSVSDLRKSLDQRFKVLRKRGRDQSDRHRSLEVVLSEAFSALSAVGLEALLRLSLCRGHFSERLAEALLEDLRSSTSISWRPWSTMGCF